MSDFDPDAFLNDEVPVNGELGGDFDPDSFLTEGQEETVEQIELQPGQIDPNIIQNQTVGQDIKAVADGLLGGEKSSSAGALVRGATESITFGLSRQLSAGINAAIDYTAGFSGDKSMGEIYNKYKTNYDIIRAQDRKDQAGANLAGQALGAVGPLGLANKVAQGTRFMQQGYKASQVGKLALFDAGIDVAANVSKNLTGVQDKNLDTILEESYTTFLFSGTAQSVVSLVGQTAKALGDSSTLRYINSSIGTSAKKYKQGVEKYVNNVTKNSTDPEVRKQALTKAVDILDSKGLNNLEVMATPGKLKENVVQAIDEVGQSISSKYRELDDIYGTAISMKSTDDKVVSYFGNVMTSSKSEVRKAEAQRALSMVRGEFFDNSTNQAKNYGMTDLWELRKNLWGTNSKQYLSDRGITNKEDIKFIKNTVDDLFQAKRTSMLKSANQEVVEAGSKIANLKNTTDDLIKEKDALTAQYVALGNIDPADANKAAKALKIESSISGLESRIKTNTNEYQKALEVAKADLESAAKGIASKTTPRAIELGDEINLANKEYQDLLEVKKGFIDNMDLPETDSGLLLNAVKSTYQNIKQPFGILTAKVIGGGAGVGAKVLGKPVLGSMANTLENIAGTTMDSMVYKATSKAAAFFRNSENLTNDVFNNRLVAKFAETMADGDLTADEAGIQLDSLVAQQRLYLAPLKRTTDDIIKRYPDIINYVKESDPSMLDIISNAYAEDDYETIAGAMDTMSKRPGIQKFFEAGQGWDGKLYDPAERQMAADNINTNINIPMLKRKELVNQVMTTGVVPDASQFGRKEPAPISPRNKGLVR
jgi:hypothetical protein